MRTETSELTALLSSTDRRVWSADLWTFTLAGNVVLRWTGHETVLRWNSQNYVPGPGLKRGDIIWRMGLDSDEAALEIFPKDTDLVGTTPLAKALSRGDFDHAGVRLDRAYGSVPGTIVGIHQGYFTGRMGTVKGDGFPFKTVIRSLLEDFHRPVPRNIVQPRCRNRLFDAYCGKDPSTYRITGTVTGGVTPSRNAFNTSLVEITGWFTYGFFRWLTGANAGREAVVREHSASGGSLWFLTGWPDAVAVGDSFEVWPGCDKRYETCKSVKFGDNTGRFRGEPFVPAPETTL